MRHFIRWPFPLFADSRCPVRASIHPIRLLPAFLSCCASLAATPQFQRVAVPLPQAAWGVNAFDVNADGRTDIVAIGDTQVYALLAPDWQRHVLADTEAGRLLHCIAVDCDRDGDLDLVIGRYISPWIQQREAQAGGKAMTPPPAGPDFGLAWIETTGRVDTPPPLHVIDREIHGVHGLWAGDVNGDGRTDFVAGSFQGPHADSVVLFTAQSEGRGFARTFVTAGGAKGRAHYLDLSDLDGDGRIDVLLAASTGGLLTVWKQPATPATPWASQLIARERGVTNVRAFDVDGDRQIDVVASNGHGTGLNWFRAPTWEKNVIDAGLRDGHAFDTGDFDGDGDYDLAVASFSEQRVLWFENRGGARFERHVIDEDNSQQAYDLKVSDVDRDGRLDFLIAGRQSKNVVWYRQVPAR